MKTVTINTSRQYEVRIGTDLLGSLGQQIASVVSHCKVAIISDSNVWPLYGSLVEASLSQSGYIPVSYVFPAGEQSKCGDTYLSILDFLARNHLTRTDLIIALGGGVTGDMAGFAAATYLRGIAYVQIPTTLLTMVDSSVGGKTAIDLPAGKNLVGAFYQPSLVLCDTSVLNSLPNEILQDGCAEVIKYGVLYDPALFSHMLEKGLAFDREYVITQCVSLKRDVVTRDEFDKGLRQKLNLGHTLGHSIEAISQYTLSHGKAVAIGMAIISAAAEKRGICVSGVHAQICLALEKVGLPTSTDYSAEAIYENALSDKKRAGKNVTLVLPTKIGSCILQPTPVKDLKTLIEAGL